MRGLKDLDVKGKRVFVRADLDVPVHPASEVHKKLDTETATRLTNLKPTVNYLVEHGAKQIIIAGHMGRPIVASASLGKPEGVDLALSTKQLLEPLTNILGREIAFDEQLTSDNLHLTEEKESIVNGQMSHVILLENLRFWEGETKNDMDFAKKLANLADVYVDDAFGNVHREHASMVALPLLLPHAAGLHLEIEVNQMNKLLHTPERPFIAIVGGAKIDTKIPVIENLSKLAHYVLVGGELPVEIKKQGLKFAENVLVAELEEDEKDVSVDSINMFCRHLVGAKTIVWNGPMGYFEGGFTRATLQLAKAIAESGAYSVVGGGDSTQFLEKEGLLSKFSFVSAGGGAMLEFLSGKVLPGIKALE